MKGTRIMSRVERAQRIYAAIARGKTNREIAAELGFTPDTVRIYVSELLADLGARNRTEAVTLGAAKGYTR